MEAKQSKSRAGAYRHNNINPLEVSQFGLSLSLDGPLEMFWGFCFPAVPDSGPDASLVSTAYIVPYHVTSKLLYDIIGRHVNPYSVIQNVPLNKEASAYHFASCNPCTSCKSHPQRYI